GDLRLRRRPGGQPHRAAILDLKHLGPVFAHGGKASKGCPARMPCPAFPPVPPPASTVCCCSSCSVRPRASPAPVPPRWCRTCCPAVPPPAPPPAPPRTRPSRPWASSFPATTAAPP